MAPFGRNFLKARLKNRTKEGDPVVGKEIQVSVGNEEKVVCGVTKHTTCADLVQALLDDHKSVPESKRLLHGDPKDFCLVEHWKGFERALPPLTRILRLWNAWGDQKPFIRFVLVKAGDFAPQSGRKLKPKGAKPKRYERHPAPSSQALPAERQKRMVKKAFRKLEKIHRDSRSSPGAEEIERMVQLILTQDHTLQEQVQRMMDLDLEMEHFHLRVQSEAETGGVLPTVSRAQSRDGHSEEQLQQYLYTSDGVEQLELQVWRHHQLIAELSQDINAELRAAGSAWLQSQDVEAQPEGAAAAASWTSAEADDPVYVAELERLQSELKHSLSAAVSLHNQAAEMDKELQCYDSALASKDQECWQLASQLSLMQLGGSGEEKGAPEGLKSPIGCTVSQAIKLKHSLSPTDITDTDSDTGISSTHSQDSLSPCLDFPPLIDTDV